MWAEAGRKASEWRRRGRCRLLLELLRSVGLLLLLLSQTCPQLHTVPAIAQQQLGYQAYKSPKRE
jgi:hypothetical protein